MEPKKEHEDADHHGRAGNENKEGEDASRMELPLTPNFPEPPDVKYNRPALKRGMYAENPDFHPGVSSEQNRINTTARLGAGMSAGITFASSVIISVLLGMWLDKRFEPRGVPWATMILTVLGFVAGIVNFMRISNSTDRKKK